MMTDASRESGRIRSLRRAGFGCCTACCFALTPAAAFERNTAGDRSRLAPVMTVLAEEGAITESASSTKPTASKPVSSTEPLIALGIGDAVSVQVYGKPELTTTTYVADDGTLTVPLAGSVRVLGISPVKAAQRIAYAFRNGNFLVDPQVTVFLVQSRSQQVSVLGAVKAPGRFAVDTKTTVLDVLAQAGGITEAGADAVVLLRPDKQGKVRRQTIDLKGLGDKDMPVPTLRLRGGDSIFVPPAEQFFIHGEVKAPNMYRLEPGMTVVQAISRGGGVGPRGSSKRVEIKRRKPDGSYVTLDGELNEPVKANDVILVKESFF